MKMTAFASRNIKEIIRDPLNLFFGLLFPVMILLLLSAIQANIPVDLFEINHLTPGIAVFGLSFISLFTATLISKDRTTSFLMRLFATPMRSIDFILAYTLPMLPIALAQAVFCVIAAVFLGFKITVATLVMLAVLIPASIIFIAIGLICGTLLNDKQVGGICGALLTNLTAWLSGIWFDIELVGGVFKSIAEVLPFYHAVNAARYAAAGEFDKLFPSLWWIFGYAVVLTAVAVFIFAKKQKVQ